MAGTWTNSEMVESVFDFSIIGEYDSIERLESSGSEGTSYLLIKDGKKGL